MIHLTLLVCSALLAPAGDPPPAALYLADVDADGLEDALVLQPGQAPRLLHGTASGGFTDVTATAGLPARGDLHLALWGDVDGDGGTDLLLAPRAGEALLFSKTSALGFTDVTAERGLAGLTGVAHAHWLELGGDQAPDLHVVTLTGDRLLRQTPAGLFADVDLGLAERLWEGPEPGTVEEARDRLGLPRTLPAATPPPDTEAAGPGSGPTVTTGSGSPLGQTVNLWCANGLNDAASPGACLSASSVPTFGALYPLGAELFIEAESGNVGIGTIQPGVRLEVAGGDVRTDGKLVSTATVGPPLEVASSTVVTGLNAEFIDGLDSTQLTALGATIGPGEIEPAAIGSLEIANFAVTPGKIDALAVSASKLADGAVILNKLADGSVSSNKLIDGAVTWSKIAGGSVFGSHLALPLAVVQSQASSATITVRNDATGQVSYALQGETLGGNLSAGLYGKSAGGQSGSYGVWGSTVGTNGFTAGVYGNASGLGSGSAVGVLGRSDQQGFGRGVLGESAATDGVGVMGVASSAQGFTRGIFGRADSPNGTAISGLALSDTGSTIGVEGVADSPDGVAVCASHTDPNGTAFSALGGNPCAMVHSFQDQGVGLAVVANAPGSFADGVWSENYDDAGYALAGINYASGNGLYAYSDGGNGVAGYAVDPGKAGVYGFTFDPGGYGVFSDGDYGGTGAKYFVQPHPEDASKEIRFVCLEGNESGTYFRGSAHVVGGQAVIDVPEEFRLVSEPDSITVQLTPRGPAMLWYESADTDRVVVRGSADVEFDYFVNGIRRGFRDVRIVTENTAYVPDTRGEPFGTQYPEDLREILVQNGILNPDYTPNEATAAALGWDLERGLARQQASEEHRERLARKTAQARQVLERTR